MSPALNQRDPNSLRSRIRDWYAAHPGLHRSQDVAVALDLSVWAVANESARLMREGRLTRTMVKIEGRKTPVPYYSVPAEGRRRAPGRKASNAEQTRQQDNRAEGAAADAG